MSLALAAFFMPGAALAQGMAVPGEASVSETGAARYTIPIAVPPGTAGMVPSLSLAYNSQAGNGLVGMGYSLEGLAAIGRCPRTMATDGVRGSVNYDANDRFCLDGQRLIAVSGTYGADGAEYRTEIESFTKVISRGTAGTGPAWFEVWTKSGQRMEFGNSTDSRILAQGKAEVRSWAVNKIADTKGNYYAVSYVNDAANGEAYPSRIDYTGNAAAGLTPYNSVRFVYESRPDATTVYHAGSMVRSTVRLSKVQTYAGNALVSDYRLTYAQGTSTGRSQLTSVTICEAGGACLPATNFTWQQARTSYSIVSNAGDQDGQFTNYRPYVADFNGDSFSDILWDLGNDKLSPHSAGTRVLWTNNRTAGFTIDGNFAGQNGTLKSSGDACQTYSGEQGTSYYAPKDVLYIANFDRDARADVFWYRRCEMATSAPTSFPTSIWLPTTSSSVAIRAGPTIDSVTTPCGEGTCTAYASPALSVLDANGDGRFDITVSEYLSQRNIIFNADGSFSSVAVPNALFTEKGVDFNGDGITDVYISIVGHSIGLGKSDGTYTSITVSSPPSSSYSKLFTDFNGDGLTDIMWERFDSYGRSSYSGSTTPRHFWLSKGDGTFTRISSLDGTNGVLNGYRPYFADFNGDGLADILWDLEHSDVAPRSNGKRELWLSKGDATFTKIANLGGFDTQHNGYAPVLGDFNGDGKIDILWDGRASGDMRSNGTRVLWLSDGQAPDILTGVSNGLGATAAITYKFMPDASVYTRDNTAVDPLIDVQAPFALVSKLDMANGVGGLRSMTYSYTGAKAHLDGRGFLGFREVKATDTGTSIIQTTTYRQSHPLTGLVEQENQSRNGLTLNATTNTHTEADLGAGRRQVTLTQSVTTGADLNGATLPTATTSYQYDGYGNATQITVTNSDGFSKITTNTYSNNASSWILGRLLTASVTSQAPSLATQLPGADPSPTVSFPPVAAALINTLYETSALPSGFNQATTAQVSGNGAQIRKNGSGTWGTSVSLMPGDRLNLRMTSSSNYLTPLTATVAIGASTINWVVTTIPGNRTIVISSNTNNVNLRTLHDSQYPPLTGTENPPLSVTAVINPGVIIGSANTSVPAFAIGEWATNVSVILNVQGRIQGAGGKGGNGAKTTSDDDNGLTDAKPGGPALHTRRAITLNLNPGQIWGGGGGGAGGRLKENGKHAGSGGGGAGQLPGLPGEKGLGGTTTIGQPGTTETGGAGGASSSAAGGGGTGGGPGQNGSQAGNGSEGLPGTAGAAIDGNSFVTRIGTGDIRGPQVN